ncbi:MAG: glycosyltransferase family 4 protein [Hyphomicrobium sp.]|nr:glycosyltransferase family 4 protein [Hyphomicrobium sp.]
MANEAKLVERVVVINDDYSVNGGAALMAMAGVQAMRDKGIPVTFITGGSIPPNSNIENVTIVSVGGKHLLEGSRIRAAARGLYDLSVAQAFSDWIGENDTPGTVYHLHNWHKVLSASIMKPLRSVSDRLIFSAHDFFLACPNGGYFNFSSGSACELTPMSAQCLVTPCDKRSRAQKAWRCVRHLVRQQTFDLTISPAKVLTVHEGMGPLLARGGVSESSIVTLRNPVRAWRAERVPAENNRRVLFVGRLERDKGIQILLSAARQLNLEVDVIGSGPDLEALRAIHPKARFFGQCSRDEIATFAATARVVVIPSLARETFSLVAVEALTSGIPVIISKFALIAQEIESLGYGLSCAPDVSELSSALAFLQDRDDVVANMSCAAFSGAQQLTLSSDEWAGRLLTVYESVLK